MISAYSISKEASLSDKIKMLLGMIESDNVPNNIKRKLKITRWSLILSEFEIPNYQEYKLLDNSDKDNFIKSYSQRTNSSKKKSQSFFYVYLELKKSLKE